MTYPIVLAHGIARFDALLRDALDDEESTDDRTHYFRRILSTLRDASFDAHHASVPWAQGVAVRSRALREDVATVLRMTGADKVHIIAHSMGGLDARHMLFDGRAEGFHRRIASLTTIGTPHRGTSFADWGVCAGAFGLSLLACLGIDSLDGFRDLTTTSCAAFNAQADAFERTSGVAFRAYAAAQELPLIFEPLKLAWHIIHYHEGANDGLVSVSSARWREEVAAPETLNADHLNEIGWWEPNDLGLLRFPPQPAQMETRSALERRIRAFYVSITQDLARHFPV